MVDIPFPITSNFYWISALIAALIDIPLVWYTRNKFKLGEHIHRYKGYIIVASGIFWASLTTFLIIVAGDFYYSHFLEVSTSGQRFLMVIESTALYSLLAWLFYSIALKTSFDLVWNFVVLGGLESLIEHMWGIYRLGILERVILFRDISAESVLAFSIPEYISYWCTALLLAKALFNLRQRISASKVQSR
jgi:hypothetical protein